MMSSQKSKAICVLGMHRSGTSAFAGILNILGVNMGAELMAAIPNDNPRGFFENKKIYQFNEHKLLPALQSCWDDVYLLPKNWENSGSLKDLYAQAKDIIIQDYQNEKLFGFKDPRLCVLFPFWEKALCDLGIAICAILSIRNPAEVAMSLFRRNGLSYEKSFLLWAKHVLYAEYNSRKYERVFITYEDLLLDAQGVIDKIQRTLQIEFPCGYTEDIKGSIFNFLEKELRHHEIPTGNIDSSMPLFIRESVTDLFKLASGHLKDGKELHDKFDRLKAEYEMLTTIFYNSDLRNKIINLEATNKDLINQLTKGNERIAGLEATNKDLINQIAERNAALAQKDAEIAGLAAQIAMFRNSKSWRITRPLRHAESYIKKLRKLILIQNIGRILR